MAYKRNINAAEWKWLADHEYTIRTHWIGPGEGYEYSLCRMGHSSREALAIRKSERACFNYAQKLERDKETAP